MEALGFADLHGFRQAGDRPGGIENGGRRTRNNQQLRQCEVVLLLTDAS